MIGWILLGVLVLLVLYVIAGYNGLVRYRNWAKEAWAQIDVQLKRRHDLIPNLVETVKGYMQYEQETLAKVIEMRSRLISGSPVERVEADNALTGTLRQLFALAEAYPDLKANETFLRLEEELATTENKVAYARQLYNRTAAEYNIRRESFPTNLIAGMFGFGPMELLAIPEAEREAPQVRFT
ncbi:LemA family protein [Hydrogenibacillus sp. N12]|uniref:LemA family protein n=1 Tax=Hydrogenibacillus sp. N12 TaxID=2866627 RepID=UPI001C7E07C4|nr:LemA family protein [Hydrogenibacillus sp. N12]QZA32125.1 LemA family protein [Hydrogenibacillus sp. N12]